MKKVQKALALALGLALGAGVLVACGGNTDNNPDNQPEKPDKPATVTYWVAGNVAGVENWDTSANEQGVNRAFTKSGDAYEIKLDMWEGDTFKVRYEGKAWGQFQANYDNSLNETQKADANGKIGADETSIEGEYNYLVKADGNYTIKLVEKEEGVEISYTYNGDLEVKKPIFVETVTLNNYAIALEVGDTSTLQATILPANADNKDVLWISEGEDVATVSEAGVVTAVKAGEADITAVVSGTKGADIEVTCHVIVVEKGALVKVSSVTLDKTAVTLKVGKGETLKATVGPENATLKTVAYVSEDASIVEVNKDTGEMLAHKPGKTKIIASADGKTAECEVTVEKTYYLRGNLIASDWPEITEVDQEGIVYFTETETKGVYKTESVTLKKNTEFQIAVVAQDWTDAIKNSALPAVGEELAETLKYFKAEGSSNIKVMTAGKYTLTLDLTGEEPALTVVQDENLPDTIEAATALRAHGDATNEGWDDAEGVTRPSVDFTKGADGKWTATLTNVTLKADGALQIRWEADGVTFYGDYRYGDKLTVPEGFAKASSSDNIMTAAGTYNVTVTLDELGEVVSIVITAATAA